MTDEAPEQAPEQAPGQLEPFFFLKKRVNALASDSVTISNTGVLSITAGANVSVDHPTGDVTITAAGGAGALTWFGPAFLAANVALLGGGVVTPLVTLELGTPGIYLLNAVSCFSGDRAVDVWLQWQDDPIDPANSIVSGEAGPVGATGVAASIGLSTIDFANTANRVIALIGRSLTVGPAALAAAAVSNAPNATGINALQLRSDS